MTDPATIDGLDHLSIWKQASDRLQEILPRQSFLTWFRPLEALSFDGVTLTLQAPSQFYCDWIESHYIQHLRQAVGETAGRALKIAFSINTNLRRTPPAEQRGVAVVHKPSVETRDPLYSHLNNRYLFENFIEGDCNKFARAAAIAVAERPGKTPFNPLMIYGGAGLGKTHLVQAIGNEILRNQTAKRVLYVTSDQFTADFVKAIQSGRSDSFSRLYRSVDVLLLDDVHFFMAKEKTQEEFFHTFNYLHHAGKQLVFSSDKPPRDLNGFDARLVSRLQWGLVSEITTPEYETRLAILKKHAADERIDLDNEVAHFLALHITDNVRTLQGAFIHMLAQVSLLGKKISVDLARDVLRSFISKAEKTISVDKIQAIVAGAFGLPSDLLCSRTRKKEIAEARQIAMFLCTECTRLTLKAIGLHFGGRDHATVIHARETISERLKTDGILQDLVERLRRELELATI